MGASGGGRRRLLVLWLLSCFALSATAEHHPGSKVRPHAGAPSSPQRGRRGIRWHKMLEPGRNDDVAYAIDGDDDEEEGEDIYPTPAPRVGHAYQEDWLMDNLLSQVQRQDAVERTDEHNRQAELRSYHKWVPKFLLKGGEAQSDTKEEQGYAPASNNDDDSATSAATTSSSTPSMVEKTDKPTTRAKYADDDIGQCPAQQAIPKPKTATDAKPGGLMDVLFGTKLTSLTTAKIMTTTTKATRTTTVHTTQQASDRTVKPSSTARKRPKIASAVQAPPKSDSSSFVINRFARVSRESAYMEHMEPMVMFACNVYLWIIGALCALVLLLAVALCATNKPRVEALAPPRPPEPPFTPPVLISPMSSPTIKRPPTEVWEDDLYDVSEISKLEKRPSVTQPPLSRFYGKV